jgi:hypothetical protein
MVAYGSGMSPSHGDIPFVPFFAIDNRRPKPSREFVNQLFSGLHNPFSHSVPFSSSWHLVQNLSCELSEDCDTYFPLIEQILVAQ